MKLLNGLRRIFSSDESAAEDALAKDEDAIEHWNSYLSTIEKKGRIIDSLGPGSPKKDLDDLKSLLGEELEDIYIDERDKSEIESDLDFIRCSHDVERVRRLDECLRNMETRYQYVHKLLQHIYYAIRLERTITKRLLSGKYQGDDFKDYASQLKEQLKIEQEAIEQISGLRAFHQLFLDLVKGEHVVRVLDSQERRLLRMMRPSFDRVVSHEVVEGDVKGREMFEWADSVLESIKDRIRELEAQEIIDYHPHVTFEFINRPEFVELAREKAESVMKKKVDERIINVFVHIFREWFNYVRKKRGL